MAQSHDHGGGVKSIQVPIPDNPLGHLCLHREEDHPARLPGHGRLFSGDRLLPGITPRIGPYEDPDDNGGPPARTRLRAWGRSPAPSAATWPPWSASPH